MYCYERAEKDIELLREMGARVFSIGKSVMGRDIKCVCAGGGEKKLFLAGAFHGLEYLTSALLVRFMRNFIRAAAAGERMAGYDPRRLSRAVTLFTVPMVNPDGVDIAVNGLDMSDAYHRRIYEIAGAADYGRVWQANARGVDINHNFDADWQPVKDAPSPTKYGGEHPESEPETRAVADFARNELFDMAIAFHSQGGEIYYDFNGTCAPRSLRTAEKMARVSGYKVTVPRGTAAYGGFKDWFIKEFGKMGFTVEIGRGKNPLPMSMLNEVYAENARLILAAMCECQAE